MAAKTPSGLDHRRYHDCFRTCASCRLVPPAVLGEAPGCTRHKAIGVPAVISVDEKNTAGSVAQLDLPAAFLLIK